MKKAILLTMFKRLTLLWSLLLMTCFMASAVVTVTYDPTTSATLIPAETINASGKSLKVFMAHRSNDATDVWWYYHVNPCPTNAEPEPSYTPAQTVGGSSYVWTLIPITVEGYTNVYNIYNEKYGYYFAKTSTAGGNVTLTKDATQAARYSISASTCSENYIEGSCYLQDIDYSGYYVGADQNNRSIRKGNGTGKSMQFLFVSTEFTGATPDALDYDDPDPDFVHYNELYDGLRVFLSHATYGTATHTDTYCYATSGTTPSLRNNKTTDITPTGWAYVWELQKADVSDRDDVYYLYNEYTNTYLGKTGTAAYVEIGLVTSKEDAGRYMIINPIMNSGEVDDYDVDAVELRNYDNQSWGPNTDCNHDNVFTGGAGGSNNQFRLRANTFKHYELYLFDEAELFVHPQSETTYYLNLEKNATNIDAVTEADWYNAWVFEQVHEMKTVNVTTTVDNVETTTPTQKWLPKGDGNIYRIINSLEHKYVGKIPASGTGSITLATDTITAGEFAVEVPTGQPNAIRLRDNDTTNENCYLVFDASQSGSLMVNGTADDTAAASTSYFYLATVSGLPDRSVTQVVHHKDLYITPHEYRDTKTYVNLGYLTAYPEMGYTMASQALNSWQSVFTLESIHKSDKDINSAQDSWVEKDIETNLNDQYRIYNRINHKYLADITTTAKGSVVGFVDTEDEAGWYQFEYDFLDGTGVAIKGVSKADVSNAPAATKTATADDYYLNFSSDNYLIHGTEDVNSVFYLTAANGESWDAVCNNEYVYWTPYRQYNYYIYPKPLTSVVFKTDHQDAYSIWQLIPTTVTADEIQAMKDSGNSEYSGKYYYGGNECTSPDTYSEHVYKFYNPITHKYICSLQSLSQDKALSTTTDADQAGRFRIYQDPENPATNIIRDVDSYDTCDYMNMNGTSTGGAINLVAYYNKEANRLFYFTTVDEIPQAIEDDQQIKDGWTFSIIPYEFFENVNPDYYKNATHSHAEGYVYEDPNKDELYTSLEKVYDENYPMKDYSLFQLEQAYNITYNESGEEVSREAIPNTWLIKNVGTGDYVKPTTSTQGTKQQMTSDKSEAGHYEIIWDYWDQTTVYFHDVDNTDQNTAWWWWNNSKSYTGVPSYNETYGGDAIANYKNNYTSNEDDNARNRFYVYPAEGGDDLTEEILDYLKWILVNTGNWIGDFTPKKFEGVNNYFSELLKEWFGIEVEFDEDGLIETVQDQLSSIDFKDKLSQLSNDDLKTLKEKYNEAKALVADEESRNHPQPKRLYYIISAVDDYEDFEDQHLAETYYEKDYHVVQDKQRVSVSLSEDPAFTSHQVPMMWYFEKQPTLNGSDALCYYYVQAANSKKAIRLTGNDKVVDVRDVDDPEAALYSLVKDQTMCITPHSVGLRSHWDNDGRTYINGYSLLGITTQPTKLWNGYELSIRNGSEGAVTDYTNQNANIWRIKLVETFPIYMTYLGENQDDYSNSGRKYYNAFYFPFDVQLPEGMKAYTGGYGLLNKYDPDNNPEKKIDLVRFQIPDTEIKDIIPAYSPVVLVTDSPTDPKTGNDWRLTVLYSQIKDGVAEESPYKPVNYFGLEGTDVAKGLDYEQTVYIFHDDRDDQLTKIVDQTDSNYGTDTSTDLHSTIDGKNYFFNQLHYSDSSYIITANTAYLPVTEEITDPTINLTDDYVTGIFAISINDNFNYTNNREPERDANGNLIYFDLMGRRIINPSAGIYILTNGQKVVVR